ncbi:MAG: hypothetical protein GY778_14560 [bacterium]|nr:hypothetical protein [bacterium]
MLDVETKYRESLANIGRGSPETARALQRIAKKCRDEGRHLAAALCSLQGHWAAWGVAPSDLCLQLATDAISDLARFVGSNAPDDWNKLLALHLLAQQCAGVVCTDATALHFAQIRESAQSDYSTLVSRLAQGQPFADALLVSGFQLTGFLDEPWEPLFPGHDIWAGNESTTRDGTSRTIGMQSAFRTMLTLGDYDGAMRVSQAHKEGLISPALRGWSIASSALVSGDPFLFAKASAQFSLDTLDRTKKTRQPWSSINQRLWAPYFMSRSHLATSCATPKEAMANLRMASERDLNQTRPWDVRQVNRYFLIIGAVRGLVDRDANAVNSAVRAYRNSHRPDLPSFVDCHVVDFLSQIQTLSNVIFGGDWIEPLLQVVRLLDRMPIFTKWEKSNIVSALNLAVPTSLQGLEKGWEYRVLSSIKDENQLHRILLALFRAEAEVPVFSKICHDPIEYGKDIVVCRKDGDRHILWQYSVKVGMVKKAAWKSDVRLQLEEIFQVPFDSPEIPGKIDERIGVLAWNEHIHSYADPLVKGWLQEQRDTFGRRFELMGIDRLVNYVTENGFGGTLRKSLRDERLLPEI